MKSKRIKALVMALLMALSTAAPVSASGSTQITLTYSEALVNPSIVTFVTGAPDASTVEAVPVSYNQTVSRPSPDPTREGYVFKGWFTDTTYTTEFDFDNTRITEDISIYAQWEKIPDPVKYTVTFETNGGTAVDAQTITENGTAVVPTAPTREGYAFGGWFTDEACTTEYVFTTPVTADITLYAQWTETVVNYTVTFDTNGAGVDIAPQTVQSGGTATQPDAPTRDGYTFGGWYSDAGCTSEYVFSTPVTGNLTLYAKWTAEAGTVTHTVTFQGDGISLPVQTVTEGETVSQPSTPVREGYAFGGWYTDAAFTTAYEFTTPVTADITLYAKWTEVAAGSFTVTFNVNGGNETIPTETVTSGSQVAKPADPTRDGYTFGGWYSDAAFTTAYVFTTPVTANLTLYAKWDAVQSGPFTVTFNTNGGSAVEAQTVAKDGKATQPAAPTKDGSTFGGWFTTADCTGSQYDFNTPVTANITLYAKWIGGGSEQGTSFPIDITVPTSGTLLLNPDSLEVNVGDSVTEAQIVSMPQSITNKSGFPVDVDVTVTGEIWETSNMILAKASTTTSTSTGKNAFLYFEMHAADNASFTGWDEAFNEEHHVVVTSTGKTKENIVQLAASGQSGSVGVLRIAGDMVKNPRRKSWTSDDGIDVKLAFTFRKAEAAAAAETSVTPS